MNEPWAANGQIENAGGQTSQPLEVFAIAILAFLSGVRVLRRHKEIIRPPGKHFGWKRVDGMIEEAVLFDLVTPYLAIRFTAFMTHYVAGLSGLLEGYIARRHSS